MFLFPFLIELFQKYHLKTNICHLSYRCYHSYSSGYFMNIPQELRFSYLKIIPEWQVSGIEKEMGDGLVVYLDTQDTGLLGYLDTAPHQASTQQSTQFPATHQRSSSGKISCPVLLSQDTNVRLAPALSVFGDQLRLSHEGQATPPVKPDPVSLFRFL